MLDAIFRILALTRKELLTTLKIRGAASACLYHPYCSVSFTGTSRLMT